MKRRKRWEREMRKEGSRWVEWWWR